MGDEQERGVRAPSGPEGDPGAHNEHGEPGVTPGSTTDGEAREKAIVDTDDDAA